MAGVLRELPSAPASATLAAAAAAASVSASPAARAAATGAAAAVAAAAGPAAPTAGPSPMEYNVGGMTRPREPSNPGTPAAKVARAGAASSGAARAAQGSTAEQGSGGAGGSGAQLGFDRLGSSDMNDTPHRELSVLVQNIDGIPDPAIDPASVVTEVLCAAIRRHHVTVLFETRTTDLSRLTQHLHGTHTLIYKHNIAMEHLGKKGHGIAVIASNVCSDYIAVWRVAEDMQCVWITCKKEVFRLSNDVILGAVYMRPQSNQFTAEEVRDHYSNLSDELARASQVTPNVLLCGDFNAKIGNLCVKSRMHMRVLWWTARPCNTLDVVSTLRKLLRGRCW